MDESRSWDGIHHVNKMFGYSLNITELFYHITTKSHFYETHYFYVVKINV